MILRELRLNKKRTVPLHDALTVVAGLDKGRRAQLAALVAGEVARRIEGGTAIDVVVRAGDLPAVPREERSSEPVGESAPAETVEEAAARERALAGELDEARRALDRDARENLAAADGVVAGVESDAEEAKARLAAAEEAARSAEERKSALAERRAGLETRRAELGAELAEAERLDSDAVAEGLAAYRRLRSVKPRPSQRGAVLADRWAAYRARLEGELPEAEPPPAYLVAPARAALDAARTAVEQAERAGDAYLEIDAAAVQQLEGAHRRVLEAEQRANQRPSRLNRRRLDGAEQAERDALVRLGVADYDDYLQRIVPAVRAGGATRSLEAARAALEDAEAVWDELHGGVPPMSDEELAAALAMIRAEAVELLGRDPGDDALEESLQSHVENVVDVAWTRDALVDALAGVGIEATGDIEALAQDWLSGAPQRRARVRELEATLAQLDEELASVQAQVGEAEPDSRDDEENQPQEGTDFLQRARRDVEAREARLAEARAERSAAAERQARAEEVERGVAAVALRLAEAVAAREAAERAAHRSPAPAAAGARQPSSVDLTLYTLARLAAHRAAPDAGALPVVVDDAYTSLPDGPRTAALDLLARVSDIMQVLYLTGSDDVAAWAEGLPLERRVLHRP